MPSANKQDHAMFTLTTWQKGHLELAQPTAWGLDTWASIRLPLSHPSVLSFPFIHSLIHLLSDQQVFIYSVSMMYQVLVIQESKLLSRIYKGLACKPILAIDTFPIFDS